MQWPGVPSPGAAAGFAFTCIAGLRTSKGRESGWATGESESSSSTRIWVCEPRRFENEPPSFHVVPCCWQQARTTKLYLATTKKPRGVNHRNHFRSDEVDAGRSVARNCLLGYTGLLRCSVEARCDTSERLKACCSCMSSQLECFNEKRSALEAPVLLATPAQIGQLRAHTQGRGSTRVACAVAACIAGVVRGTPPTQRGAREDGCWQP